MNEEILNARKKELEYLYKKNKKLIEKLNNNNYDFYDTKIANYRPAIEIESEELNERMDFIKNEATKVDKELKEIFSLEKFPYNYSQTIIDNMRSYLNPIDLNSKNIYLDISSLDEFKRHSKILLSSFDILKKLGYGNRNICIIGANGSGKTFFTDKLKSINSNESGLVIPAQKRLISSNTKSMFHNPPNLREISGKDMKNKNYAQSLSDSDNLYSAVLYALINNHISVAIENNKKKEYKDISKLDEAMKIWNSLITDKELFYNSNNDKDITQNTINVKIKKTEKVYDICGLSDGEKVILYFIGQVLFAPENSYIAIDEPETFIHKAILYKLWDTLENLRHDCIFIYLTHDLDFVSSRNEPQVMWIKLFTYDSNIQNCNWEIETLENNEDIPKELLYNIVGSKKPTLFFEGTKSSEDYSLYKILYPNYTHQPVEGCQNIINYTRAANRILSNHGITAKGLIDRDHRLLDQIDKFKEDKIQCLKYSEIENVFLSEWFLREYCNKTSVDKIDEKIENIKKKVIESFEKDIDKLSVNYIKSYIDYKFNTLIINENKNIGIIESEFKNHININIKEIYEGRKKDLNEIKLDYEKILTVYNHKGLVKYVMEEIGHKKFLETALKILRENEDIRKKLAKNISDLETE